MLSEQDVRIEDLEKLVAELTDRVRAQAIQKKTKHVPADLKGEVLQMENFFPNGDLPVIEVWATQMEAARLHDHINDLCNQILSLTVKTEKEPF